MGDLISRQDTIDRINGKINDVPHNADGLYDIDTGMYVSGLNVAKEMLLHMPSVQKWVLCSERLPEKEVLCCDIRGEIMIGYIDTSNESETNYIAESEHEYMYDCIAWMSLPEALKGDS